MRNKALVISIVFFIICAVIALVLILNKGHVGDIALVNIEQVVEDEKEAEPKEPEITLEIEKEYLSSKNKKDKSKMTVYVDGKEVTEGVEFESSDPDIAKVNKNNELVPVSDGRVTITATYDGLETWADIAVITPIKSMTFTSTNSTIRVGKDLQMKLQLTPANAYTDTLEYSSSDEEIATVNANGIVTGVAPGKVTITVFDTYTEIEKKVNLTIRK